MTEHILANLDEVQPIDVDLTGLAGLSTTGLVRRTGAGTFDTVTGTPIFILATGQSNIVQNAGTNLSPTDNVFTWNNTVGTDGANGTAFVALNTRNSFTNGDAFAIEVAKAYRDRNVYVVNVGFGAQDISHWMVGAGTPDAYANILANIVPALAAAGVDHIDVLLWWQGENQTANPSNYVNDWETVLARFKAESWFPRATQVLVYGLAPESVSASAVTQKTDATNSRLQEIVQREPDTRRFIYTGVLENSFWDGTLHLLSAGVKQAAILAFTAFERGPPNSALINPLTHTLRGQVLGRPANRNLMRYGDFSVDPWRFGTTFTSVADGTQITDDIYWRQSGTGVVDIKKTADAPTIAQAGVFTQHCIHVDVTTADTDLSTAGDYYGLEARLPARNVSFLGFGQTGAKPITWSFMVKSGITGNYFVALQNSAQNRYYNTQYTVNAADTWEKKTITIPGDLAGTWLYEAGIGIRAFFSLASGDTYLFGPDTWGTGDVRVGNVTRANGMSSTSNNFKLALIQPEEGIDASVFDRRPFTADMIVLDKSAVAVSYTGATGESILKTIKIPGNLIGANGRVEIWTTWSNNNSGNNKIMRVRWGASGAGTGGTALYAQTHTTNLALSALVGIANRNATNSQILVSSNTTGNGIGGSTSALITAAVDTTGVSELVLSGDLANSGDTVTLEAYRVVLFPG